MAPDAGSVLIEDVDITRRPPYDRPTNTVFQSYALFPHMSVGANVAFGLAMDRVSRREKDARVAEALAMVGLQGLQKSRVSEFSGGQQQRVALARALVKRPAVLLLDEPLGALDLKLRKQMQDELARLKSSSSTTFIHVTHDQEEACAIADRIAVMKDGEIVQVDDPFSLYRNPRNTFVSSFLDAGTIIRGAAARAGDVVEVACSDVTVRAPASNGRAGVQMLAAVIPPDRVRVSDPSAGTQAGADARGRVVRVVFTGTTFLSYVLVGPALEIKVSLSADKVAALPRAIEIGAEVALSWRPDDVILVEDSEDDVMSDAAVSE